jgi:hypothetical protein
MNTQAMDMLAMDMLDPDMLDTDMLDTDMLDTDMLDKEAMCLATRLQRSKQPLLRRPPEEVLARGLQLWVEVQLNLFLPIPLEEEYDLGRVVSDVYSLTRAGEVKTLRRAFGDKRMRNRLNEGTPRGMTFFWWGDQELLATSDHHHFKTE